MWTKNSREDGSGYYFKSKVSIATEARNFYSTLVTLQWLKPKLAEHDLNLKSQALQAKTRCTDQVAPETAKETATLAEMPDEGYVINISNEWCGFFA